MNEKILSNRKFGMLALILIIASYAAAFFGIFASAASGSMPLLVICIIWLSLGWILLLGLKVLKPQETVKLLSR